MQKNEITLNTSKIKIDKKTGRKYFGNNIPVGRLNGIKGETGRQYKIFSEAGNETVWHDGIYLGDRYAVFVKEKGFWCQISKWYCRYGNALKILSRCG